MRILLVSPHFKPLPGGVSDYSYQFASELVKAGHDVVVVTRAKPSESFLSECAFKIVSGENFSLRMASQLKELCLDHEIDVALFQWTPLAFAPESLGIIPSLALTFFFLRSIPIHLMVHESHYPVLFNPRGLLIGLPHFLQFILFSFFVRKLYFSHEAAKRYWENRLFFKGSKALETLPVFSNIPVVREHLKKSEVGELRLVYFGGQHPTNDLALVRQAFDNCRGKLGDRVVLRLIGITNDNCPHIFKGEGISALGFLPEEEVSRELHEASLILAPFTDGVSTRRGSVMAALAHQKAILTTDGICTMEDIPWHEIVQVVPQGDKQAFEHYAYELLQDKEKREHIGQKGHDYYMTNFKASKVVSRYLASF